MEDEKTTEILYGGGAGSGKSYLGCVWHIYRRTKYAGSRGLIGRAKISNLEQSTLVTYFNVANLLGYQIGRDFTYNSQKHTVNWSNGSQTILKDLFLYPSDPDFISLGSTEFTDAFIDEVNEITEKAFDIVNSRIRYKLSDFGLTPKILMTCNPSPGWVRDKYISRAGIKADLLPYQKVVRALVTDNPDEQFVELYRTQLSRMKSDYDRARLLDGDWDATPSATNPFLYALDPTYHFTECQFDARYPLIISIDFNLNPFCVTFSQAWRDEAGLHFTTFDEMTIENGSLQEMAYQIKNRYGRQLLTCKLTGDAMGNQRNISQADNASNYETLRRLLGLRQGQIMANSNPTHEMSRNDCNYLLNISLIPHEKYKVLISPSRCPLLCQDMRTVQCNEKGEMIKKNRTIESQRADLIDTWRYTVHHNLKPEIGRHQKQNFGRLIR